MIENIASNVMKKKEKNQVVELYYDFQKAYDNANHGFWRGFSKCTVFHPAYRS